MSNRNERREAERLARKLAYQQLRQPESAVEPSPISEAQLQANRANARLSSGPSTPAGKAISARNNTRHGLAADANRETFRVLPTEDQRTFDDNRADFLTEWKPVTATEWDLVERMVMHQWLSRRALRLQETLFHAESGEVTDVKKFELYRRYENSHERGFNKASADLQRLRSFQLRQQNGFESQVRKNEEHQFKIRRLQRQEDLQIQKMQATNSRLNTSRLVSQSKEEQKISA